MCPVGAGTRAPEPFSSHCPVHRAPLQTRNPIGVELIQSGGSNPQQLCWTVSGRRSQKPPPFMRRSKPQARIVRAIGFIESPETHEIPLQRRPHLCVPCTSPGWPPTPCRRIHDLLELSCADAARVCTSCSYSPKGTEAPSPRACPRVEFVGDQRVVDRLEVPRNPANLSTGVDRRRPVVDVCFHRTPQHVRSPMKGPLAVAWEPHLTGLPAYQAP